MLTERGTTVAFEDQSIRPAFLDLLLMARDSNGQPFSDEDIEEETSTFMFEGHGRRHSHAECDFARPLLMPKQPQCSIPKTDTTAAAMAWTILMIAVHRPVQERLQKEVDEFFDGLNGQPPT